jgi:hypothetical protein
LISRKWNLGSTGRGTLTATRGGPSIYTNPDNKIYHLFLKGTICMTLVTKRGIVTNTYSTLYS